ncbi:MAG: glycoside hydrolase family 3 protein, partial [Clostridia bacterium]|nr:glycoside hydrolase family 3 protein [Clostridia bacterium]
TRREKVLQLFMVTPEMLSGQTPTYAYTEALEAGFRASPVGGVILFGQNIASGEALLNMNEQLLSLSMRASCVGAFLAITEEGGDISPLTLKLGLETLPPSAYLNAGNASEQGEKLASRLLSYGFNMDFCPCADLFADEGNAEIGERAYSWDAYAAADCASLISMALENSGVVSVYKHFPGIGSVPDALTRRGRGTIPENPAEMRARALIPYLAAIAQGCAMIQVSAMDSAALDPGVPCCLSPAAVGMLRNDLGYQGVIVTDSMRSALITEKYGAGAAAVAALSAGCDLILLPDDLSKAVDGVLAAMGDGRLSERRIDESVQRVLEVKLRFGLYKDAYAN